MATQYPFAEPTTHEGVLEALIAQLERREPSQTRPDGAATESEPEPSASPRITPGEQRAAESFVLHEMHARVSAAEEHAEAERRQRTAVEQELDKCQRDLLAKSRTRAALAKPRAVRIADEPPRCR